MRATWRLGSWRGVPITIHWSVLLGLPWLYYVTRSAAGTAVAFAALFFLLMAHEIGHAAVAQWRKVRVRSIRLFLIHGVCTHDEPYHEEDDILIAWGGVAVQFVVLVIASAAALLLATFSPGSYAVASPLFRVLIVTNLVIMIVNLIPVEPLDGARAWRILPRVTPWIRQKFRVTNIRKLTDLRAKARDRDLEAESERIAADIIEKLKKSRPDV